MICTTYFLTFFSELIPPTGYLVNIDKIDSIEGNLLGIGKNKIPLSRTYKETALEIILKNKLLKDG